MHDRSWGGAALLVSCLAGGCETTIASGLDELQANAIVVALDEHGIGAAKSAGAAGGDEPSWEIVVPADDVARALTILRASELPREAEPGIADVFGEGGLVPTATEERARYVSALGGELARSIEAIDGVLDARVHVALPEGRDFALDEAAPRPRASVLIKHRTGRPPYDEAQIRALVAGAVPEMGAEDVAVVGVAAPEARTTTSSLVRIGPIAVTHGSAASLKTILGTSLGLHALFAVALALVWMRGRRAVAAAEARAAAQQSEK